MKKKTSLKDKEKIILQFIDEVGGTATPNEIAEGTGISYITVRKYLDKLVKEKILEKVEDGKKKK